MALASAGGGPLPDEVFGVAALASLPSGGGATTFVLLGFGGGGGSLASAGGEALAVRTKLGGGGARVGGGRPLASQMKFGGGRLKFGGGRRPGGEVQRSFRSGLGRGGTRQQGAGWA